MPDRKPRPVARAREAARPFIPGRHLATSLCTGSRALLERGAAWVAAGDGTQGSVTRLGGVAAGAVGIVLLVDQHPPMMTPLTAAWCVAAWTLAPAPTPRNDQDEPGEEQPAEAVPPAAHIVALAIREITADTGQRGAHLDTIADALPGATKQTVRQALDAAGIPVTEGLNLKAAGGRQRNRQGVLLRDLPDGLGHLPDTPAPGPPGSPDRGPAYTPVTPHPQPGPAPAPHTPNSPHPPAR